jgi:hypothetical protein
LILDGGAEEEEQDQRENEGVAEPHTKFQQGQQHKTNKALYFTFSAPEFGDAELGFVMEINGLLFAWIAD